MKKNMKLESYQTLQFLHTYVNVGSLTLNRIIHPLPCDGRRKLTMSSTLGPRMMLTIMVATTALVVVHGASGQSSRNESK